MDPDLKHLIDINYGQFSDCSQEIYDFFEARFSIRQYAAKDFLVEAGTVAKYFYLVQSGVQAIYLINGKGEKVILGFSYDGSPSGMYDSFVQQVPSHYFLEAITPTQAWAMNLESYKEMFARFPHMYRWRSHFMEIIFFGRVSREVELLTLSAKERYDAFIKRCPKELLQIPQKYLASYLNMQPETFSRLRAQRD